MVKYNISKGDKEGCALPSAQRDNRNKLINKGVRSQPEQLQKKGEDGGEMDNGNDDPRKYNTNKTQ